MNRKRPFLFFIPLFLISLYSCSTKTIEPNVNRQGFNFVPVTLEQFAVYDVERIDYKISSDPDTNRYELKEVIEDFYLNQEGDTVFILHQYTRLNDAEEWETDSIHWVSKNDRQILRSQNNTIFVKLIFPVKEGIVWDGNSFNSQEEEFYRIDSLDQTFRIDQSVFDNTLTVFQSEQMETTDKQDYRYEIYARNIGMIYKYSSVLEYCNKDITCINQEIIESGYRLTQKLKDYGKE